MADGAATLAALTAASVARIVPHLPECPRDWIVSGGGARNPTLMKMLAERLKPATVETADAAGWSSQAHGGAGLRLSGGAHAQRAAADVSEHDRGAGADAGRGGGEAVRP